ncbi:MAG: class I SAM-dependent methyltransferase, partial [Sphingobacteriaceae bacterium]|nr:class I SAM-dependent methyltransferase [Cytophagaceae bacterium]
MQEQKIDSREVGLDVGLLLLKYFVDTDYLHYGYFKDGLKPTVTNFKKAQENHTELLFSAIPSGVRSILDVGCGSGCVARQLRANGYEVEAVSPSEKLSEAARCNNDHQLTIHQGTYEAAQINRRFDLILFSESYQYVDIPKGLTQAIGHLNPGGHILLCDFFQTDAEGKSPLGGGHNLAEFYETLRQFPFTIVLDQDITPEIAPTMTLINDFSMKVLKPASSQVGLLLED